MSVARATTPTFSLVFTEESLDLTTASNVYVTFEQKDVNFTKEGADLVVEAKRVEVFLSQEETLQFQIGTVDVQVNWTMSNGRRASSDVKQVEISKQLLRQVVS